MESSSSAPAKKRVVLGLPGREFSSNFLISLVRSLYALWDSNKYEVVICPAYSSFVTFSRMKTLGLDVTRGIDQKPFDGMAYDVYVTIDSDIVFSPEQLVALIEATDVHPVVSGLYRMADLQHFACVKNWDTSFFIEHGSFQFMTPEEIKAWKEETKQKYLDVSYNGMGFFACRKEVLDAMQYPYFYAELQEIVTPDGKVMRDMCSEDVAFCMNIQKAGFSVMVDTDLVVGHEKTLII
jgi:hypothetical protein